MTPLPAARTLHFLFSLLLLCLTIAAMHGCGGGDGDGDSHPAGTANRAAAPPASCPGARLAGKTTVIHVATTGADSDSCGDKPDTSCATIAQGIARCTVAGCAVAVRHGLYPTSATIRLRDAVSVHGSCRFGEEPERHYRTVIAAAPPAGEPAIDAAGINSATELSGIVVLGKDETAPGEASIAMRVSASKGLTLAAVTLAAGRGGDGASGSTSAGGPGGAGTTPGQLFAASSGGLACPSSPPASGGNGGVGHDVTQFTIQGASCGPDCLCAPVASAVPPAQLAGQPSGKARGGGSGGVGAFGGNCTGRANIDPTPGDGSAGLPGEVGDCTDLAGKPVTDASSAGRFAAGRWLAGVGGQGGAGGAGSGGGGGGAGGYSVYVPFVGSIDSYSGFPGGGGGGGCGAPGGSGGQQGGASIPLVLINATIPGLSAGGSLIPGPGGNGGAGGAGGSGGPGGAGGAAYNGAKVSRQYGFVQIPMPGAGGNGGPGGASAGGAGGNGGPSFAIALVGSSPDPKHDAVYTGTPGAEGRHGAGSANPALPGNINSQCRSADALDGIPGVAKPVVQFAEES